MKNLKSLFLITVASCLLSGCAGPHITGEYGKHFYIEYAATVPLEEAEAFAHAECDKRFRTKARITSIHPFDGFTAAGMNFTCE